jgi:hypothetical protein
MKPIAAPDHPFAITVHTSTPSWVFIKPGASLALKLDGTEMMQLSGPGSTGSRTVISADMLRENATYTLTVSQLARIAKATKVEFRIFGDEQEITGSWGNNLIVDAGAMATQGPGLIGLSAAMAPGATGAAPASTPASAGGLSPGQGVELGVRCIPVNAALAASLKLPSPDGFMIVLVEPGSAADKAGIRAGDVLLRFDNVAVATPADVQTKLGAAKPGDRFPVEIWRGAAKTTLDVQF